MYLSTVSLKSLFLVFFFLDTSVRIAGETGCLSFYICMRFLHHQPNSSITSLITCSFCCCNYSCWLDVLFVKDKRRVACYSPFLSVTRLLFGIGLLCLFFSPPGAVSLDMSNLPKGLLKEVACCLIPAITFPRLTPQRYLIWGACSLAPAWWLCCSPEDLY